MHFGDFDADLQSGELRKHGIRIKLQIQPCQVLQALLEHPGQLVTREELQKRIWPADTFVDFDHGLNNAVKKLREALGDNAENPRFIETLSKRGYRFIAAVHNGNGVASSAPAAAPAAFPRTIAPGARRMRLAWGLGLGLAVLAALALALGLNAGGMRDRLLGRSVPPRIQSLAVLPLQNLSADPDQEYFSDGMTDALITDLAQVASLKVISRTSSMRYKGTKKSLPEIARELNVDGIVEGTVQRSGDRVRITAQLIHGPSDKHLWAHSYERELRDTLQLQEELAHDIGQRIVASLPNPSGGHSLSAYPLNVEAYDDYLKGRNYVRRESKDGALKGIEFLDRSVQQDPNYAPAFAELAFAYYTLAFHLPPAENIEKSRAAASKALALDQNLPDAHSLLGLIDSLYEWDWAAGEKEFKRAIQSDPNSSFARSQYAFYLDVVGRKTDALQEINTALELDPFSPARHYVASFVYLCARQYDTALREARRAVDIDPGFALGHLALSNALRAKGTLDEAFAQWLQYMRLQGATAFTRDLESAAKRKSGPADPFQKVAPVMLKYFLEGSKKSSAQKIGVAWAYMLLGDKDRALEWLDKASQQHEMQMYAIAVDPDFDPLRSDPRFGAILRRIGLPR